MKGPFKIARFFQESFLHMLLVLAQSLCGNEGSAVLCAAPPTAYTGLLSPPGPTTPALHILLLQSFGGIPQCVKIRKVYIKKWRRHFVNKGPFSQGYDFSSGHVWM